MALVRIRWDIPSPGNKIEPLTEAYAVLQLTLLLQLGYNGERIRHAASAPPPTPFISAHVTVKSGPKAGWKTVLWRLAWTGLVLLFIANLTLKSARLHQGPLPFFCLLGCGSQEIRDLVSNIILFIPLGWVLRYWASPRVGFGLCVLATVGIEATQALVLTGRDPSLRDLLTNAAGGAIGLWLFDHWRAIARPDPAGSRRLGLIAFGGWCLVLLLTGFGVRPMGSSHPWFGHWANHLQTYARFDGVLQQVEINGWTPPAGPIPQQNPLAAAIARQQIEVQVRAINREVTRPTALIFAVMDEFDNEMLFVGGARRSVQFQTRTRFDAWGLRGLSLRLPLDPSERGDTLDITAQARPDQWKLTLKSRGEVHSIALPLTVGIGWITLLPAPLAMAYEWYVMNALWLGLLIAPAAYWFHRSDPRRTLLVAGAGTALILLTLPRLLGLASTTPSDWIGTALGLIFGALLARRSLHRHPPP